VSSKALAGKNSYYMKVSFKEGKDEVSSKAVSEEKSVIHFREFGVDVDVVSDKEWLTLKSKVAIRAKAVFRSEVSSKS